MQGLGNSFDMGKLLAALREVEQKMEQKMDAVGSKVDALAGRLDSLEDGQKMLKKLADFQISVAVGDNPSSRLAFAAAQDDVALFNRFFEEMHLDPENAWIEGGSLHALHHAAVNGNCEILTKLLLSGVDVNLLTKHLWDHARRTAMDYACEKKKDDAAILLLKHGATVPAKHRQYVQDVIIKMNIDVNEQSEEKETLVTYACRAGDAAFLKFLHARGANLHIQASTGAFPIHIAAWNRYKDVAAYLLDHDGKIDSLFGSSQQTPLMLTCKLNRDDDVFVQFLLDRHADVNKVDNEGYSALHHAAKKGHRKIIQKLLEAGVDTDLLVDGKTFLDLVPNDKREDIKKDFAEFQKKKEPVKKEPEKMEPEKKEPEKKEAEKKEPGFFESLFGSKTSQKSSASESEMRAINS